jgi:hypothetical protein
LQVYPLYNLKMNSKPLPENHCPECGCRLVPETDCEEYFHQMLFWENERAENGEVHHLAVLCYYLQHPSRYSQEGLEYAQQLLLDFIEKGISPQAVRRSKREQVDSGKRGWKVTARPGDGGVYAHPPSWTVNAADVVAGGIDGYRQSVRAWAAAMLEAIKIANQEAK